MKKSDIIDWVGSGSQQRVAERLGYKGGTQVVYNWPEVIESGLLEAIIMRMQAKRIRVPPEWLSESVSL